ncbi:hypothetical protein H7Q97_08310 [Ochrobactrum sp. CM-21-5]|nr:hypothetical protein [Ochrobactrum sp. CM-21-5]MBC2885409.1 hypothetical protein [Ochrobactrum sp. CM-21-5]
MEATQYQAPILSIPVQSAREFAHKNLLINGALISLADTKDRAVLKNLAEQASHFFADLISEIQSQLNRPSVGIVAIDVPQVLEDATADAIVGSLIAMSLTQAIMPSLLDRENDTPFSIFTASKDNSEKLDHVGIRGLTPTDVLDFHSDGSIAGEELSVPDYISIFNVFINYHNRGNFYWVPTSAIPSFSQIVEKVGLSQEYCFSLTPAVYDNGKPDVKVVDRRARVAIFTRTSDGSITTFMNGTFDGRADKNTDQEDDVVAEIKNAISTNPIRYSIPQESRRLIIFNNANGFHARDIFEGPMEEYPVTRTYLRSASISGKVVGQIIEG